MILQVEHLLPLDMLTLSSLYFKLSCWLQLHILCTVVFLLTRSKKAYFSKRSNLSCSFIFTSYKHIDDHRVRNTSILQGHHVHRGLTRARSRTLSPDFSIPPLVTVVSYSVYPYDWPFPLFTGRFSMFTGMCDLNGCKWNEIKKNNSLTSLIEKQHCFHSTYRQQTILHKTYSLSEAQSVP